MARPKEFDRDKALESALATFRKNGFGATTTDDLRLAMGIGRQSFYDTFKGKREIYLEALPWIFRDLQEVWISSEGA